ncbi:N-acyl homoserine lactonase family protein [Oceanibium sediminis]|uniref:N-acyl homoserine lactonase family protein n=1 Tax=Oceanibium sediminis TaxID=2026339 RepID=UPI000DD36758|nr:N-acyl homoserine lactonase family protein [Oceanibium sediminis]
MSDTWNITAFKYAERNQRTRRDSFLFDDDHAAPHDMDYYIWLLESEGRRILVDTGYDRSEGQRRDRPIETPPERMLADHGIAPESIETVVLTHLHYDHAGALAAFPGAGLVVQEAEMAYATGPCMCHDVLRMPFTGEHICDMVRALFAGRVSFVSGSTEIAPGVEVHLIGGHSRGLQAVRVRTRRGWVVLASDASHYYENFLTGKPFPIVVDLDDMLSGFKRLLALGGTPSHIVPGHDPLVRRLYPSTSGGNVVTLHADPKPGVMGPDGRALQG